VALTSAAAFVAGQAGAPLSIESAFGTGLATQLVVAPPALAQTLGGVSVTVKDSAGVSRPADLYFVGPGQINFVVPAGTAAGLAQIGVQSGSQTSATSTLRIQPVAPALFSANSDGRGAAAAIVLRVAADGTQTSQVTFACGALAGSCANTPIDLATGQQTYLLLFGSGIRGRTSLANVSATVGGVTVPVAYAGDQGQFAGFDQVNLGPLPASLSGKSSADVLLTVDGVAANGVTVGFK
jgi:uncharacterized protein (TIGR03437 family)